MINLAAGNAYFMTATPVVTMNLMMGDMNKMPEMKSAAKKEPEA